MYSSIVLNVVMILFAFSGTKVIQITEKIREKIPYHWSLFPTKKDIALS
jgi:hypothetical protein